MNRDVLGPLLVALLAALALGVGASALDSPTPSSGAVGGGGGATGLGGGSTFDLGRPAPTDVSGESPIPSIVFQLLAATLVVAFLVSLFALRDELGLRDLGIVAVLSVLLAGLLAGLHLLLSLGGDRPPGEGGLLGERAPTLPGGGDGGAVDGAARTLTTDPPLLAIALAAALLLGAVVALRSRDDPDAGTESTPPEPSADVAGIARTAGRAADRIEDDSTAENEVYRAWREMTTHLDVERPESSTPDEFARAATRAGMAHEDVAELTDLFSTVRYGGHDVTAERETRAVAALRRIEHEYAEVS